MEAVAGSLLGILFGMRHACEPDHLAAISTLVVEERSARKGLLLGMVWGLGHTAALFGGAVALTFLRAGLPAGVADAFELGVALLVLASGAAARARGARGGAP